MVRTEEKTAKEVDREGLRGKESVPIEVEKCLREMPR